MMYFVVEVSSTAAGTASATTRKDDKREAEMLFHQVMASMMANTNVYTGFCTILDEYGRQDLENTKYYSRPAILVAPEEPEA